MQNRGKHRTFEAQASHRKTSALKLSHDVALHIGNVFCYKSFRHTVLCRAIKNKNSNFREFRSFMGQLGAENDVFIFRALHVGASFPPLSLECLPLIYECFMFLEFCLKLFIKIAIDENVFFSLNSREIAENDGFWSEMGVNRG